MPSRANAVILVVLLVVGGGSLALGLAANLLALLAPSPRPGQCGQIVVAQVFLHLIGTLLALFGVILLRKAQLRHRRGRVQPELGRLGD